MRQFRARRKERHHPQSRTLREMYRPHFVDPDFETFRSIGFATWIDGANIFVGHDSACPGFRTAFTLDPEKRVGVVVIANAIHL